MKTKTSSPIQLYEAPLGTWIKKKNLISYVRLIMSYVRHKLSRTYDLLCRTYDLNACMVSIQFPCVQRGHEASAKHSSISSGF